MKRVSLHDLMKGTQPRGISIFAAKPTSIVANSEFLVVASEDKCIRIIPLQLIEKAEAITKTVINNKKQAKV